MIKLWHDDVRVAPPGWLWVRTNEHAQAVLLSGLVEECSLDHDLGLDHVDPLAYVSKPEELWVLYGDSPQGDGRDLVRWMIAKNLVPAKVTIHSWNPAGAAEMAKMLNDVGHDVFISPAQLRVA